MKILFSGYHNPHFAGLPECIEKAIKSLGHDLESHDYRRWLVPGRIRAKFPPINSWDMRRINNDLISRARKFKPDLVLVNGGWTISPETVTRVKEVSGAVTVNWIADFPYLFNTYLKNGPFYDHFFSSGTDALRRYAGSGNKNGHWLPFACDPELHRPVELTEEERARYSCDICFVGSNYTERREVLEKLCDFDLGIWGIGWEKLPDSSPLKRHIRGGILSLEEWVKVFSASKITLNILGHRCDVTEPYVDDKDFRMTNTKVFEILACGAFQLVEDRADAEALFKDKEHLVFYRNANEVADLVEYYLKNSRERKRIAENGRREVLDKHTYGHRLTEMFSVAGMERQ